MFIERVFGNMKPYRLQLIIAALMALGLIAQAEVAAAATTTPCRLCLYGPETWLSIRVRISIWWTPTTKPARTC